MPMQLRAGLGLQLQGSGGATQPQCDQVTGDWNDDWNEYINACIYLSDCTKQSIS